MSPPTDEPRASISRHIRVGGLSAALLLFGVFAWGATTDIDGAVVSTGALVVDSHVKAIQHAGGGVVSAIKVRNGDHVEAGALLVALDPTQKAASLAIVLKRLDQLGARAARLAAERDRSLNLQFPADLAARRHDTETQSILAGEERLFGSRKISREGRQEQLKERILQTEEEIRGLEAQAVGKDRELLLIERELTGVRNLWKQGLVSITRMSELERAAARLTGERGALAASIAQARGKIVETRLQSIQIDDDLQTEVSKELREIEGEIGELIERRVAAEDDLRRLEVRSPQAGIVHELKVHSQFAVVAPAETIMIVVPSSDQLIAEVRIESQDIDQVYPGQKAVLRFSAFSARTTPELNGIVERVSADLSRDPQSGVSYYLARVSTRKEELDRLGGLKLLSGMPVEALIKTGERTALSYLMKPMSDQIQRAFREE